MLAFVNLAGLQRFETVTETPSRRISRPHMVEFAPTPDIDRDVVSGLEQDSVVEQSATEPSKYIWPLVES